MAYPPPFIVEPQPGHPHTHTAILLHGRSSTAEEFATDLFSLKTSTPQRTLPECFPFFRWVFPDAGQRWCTLFRGKQSAWFDTFSLDDLSERQDLQVSGLRDGIHFVKSTLEKEVENLGGRAERVILGGFSQGSATVLWSLFTGAAMGNGRLGAFVGLGAWMPFTREAKKAVSVEDSIISRDQRAGNLVASFSGILGIDSLSSADVGANLQQTPVYLGHGTDVRENLEREVSRSILIIRRT